MLRSWKGLLVAAVTVPAAAYVVGEAVVTEPPTSCRSALVLSEAPPPERPSGTAPRAEDDAGRQTRRDSGPGSCAAREVAAEREDDREGTGSDRDGDDTEDSREVRLVRPCPAGLGDHDADDRTWPDNRTAGDPAVVGDDDDGDDGDDDD